MRQRVQNLEAAAASFFLPTAVPHKNSPILILINPRMREVETEKKFRSLCHSFPIQCRYVDKKKNFASEL